MLKKISIAVLLWVTVIFALPSMAAEDPTLHQVYEAAQAGKLDEAQSMMKQVLHDHPNSAKAHFVEAELLAKQNRLANADAELKTAERLAPGLPFAKPQAVQNLKSLLSSPRITNSFAPTGFSSSGNSRSGISWGMLLIGVGVILVLVFFVRSRNRNNTTYPSMNGSPQYGTGFASQPYATNGMATPMAQTGGGIGSSIVGGLATGAAVGAGMVAGEALMHNFTDGNRQNYNLSPPVDSSWNTTPDNMGSADFGIADNSSWDDSSSDVSDDWDS
jgi:uncharacterized protein